MKNLILILFMFSCTVNGQIVNILDANFKAKLIALGVDTNSDGEIQTSEALVPTTLNVSSSAINDLTGIEAFTNVITLEAQSNQLSSIDLSNNIGLKFLRVNDNQITSLNLTNLVNLESLWCFSNNISTFNFVNNLNLKVLICSYNPITTLDLSNNTNLEVLFCENNILSGFSGLTQLDLSGLVNLKSLDCSGNTLGILNLSEQVNLIRLRSRFNSLSTIDVSPLVNLTYLDLAHNQLSTLDLTNNTSLINLFYENNSITNLDISSLVHLKQLSIAANSITNLVIPNAIQLERLNCAINPIVELDLSNQFNLIEIACGDPALERVFIKNGNFDGDTFTFGPNSPNLQFVCGDEEDIAYLSLLYPSIVFNTYCTFIPAGNYNTITGSVRIDATNNGCDTSDFVTTNLKVNINDGTSNEIAIVNNQSLYSFFIGLGNYTVTPLLENPSYFNVSPTTATANFPLVNNATQTKDFCLTTNGIHQDVEIVIIPKLRARPGFDVDYLVVYKNKGTEPASGSINVTFDDSRTDFVTASPTVNNQVTNSLTWNYTNLQPFERRYISFTLNLNSPMEIPPLNQDDILNFTTTISAPFIDEFPNDNAFTLNQTVINSYDPNEKTCLEGAIIAPSKIGEYVHYNIDFENLGNGAAEKVVVKDVIDVTKFDINSLEVLYTSHPMIAKFKENTIEFLFDNINLAPASGNPPVGGKGNVLFKIKTLSSLVIGDQIKNKAAIYFDYNFPITTDEAISVFQTLSIGEFDDDKSVIVYPNPTNSNIAISSDFNIKSVTLFDIQGRILETNLVNNVNVLIDISSKPNGVYFVKIKTANGHKIEKIVKK